MRIRADRLSTFHCVLPDPANTLRNASALITKTFAAARHIISSQQGSPHAAFHPKRNSENDAFPSTIDLNNVPPHCRRYERPRARELGGILAAPCSVPLQTVVQPTAFCLVSQTRSHHESFLLPRLGNSRSCLVGFQLGSKLSPFRIRGDDAPLLCLATSDVHHVSIRLRSTRETTYGLHALFSGFGCRCTRVCVRCAATAAAAVASCCSAVRSPRP